MNWRLIIALVMGIAVLASAIAVVSSKHQVRQQYQELVALESDRDRLDTEWWQLQLEQSSWATHGRIESTARDRLRMTMPDIGESVMVLP